MKRRIHWGARIRHFVVVFILNIDTRRRPTKVISLSMHWSKSRVQ